jgi:aspartyl-tRNA synthetase
VLRDGTGTVQLVVADDAALAATVSSLTEETVISVRAAACL